MTYIVNIDSFDKDEWHRYAGDFADYSIYQTWAYQQVRAEMDGQSLSRAIIKDQQDQVVTMCQVRIKSVRALGLRIGYVQWGPLVRKKDGQITCSVEALRQLQQTYLGQKVNVLRIVPNTPDNEIGQRLAVMLQEAGFAPLSGVKPYHTFLLPADDSERNIRARLHKSFRRDLNYAEKIGIEIREGTDHHFCDIIEKLYIGLVQRKKFKALNPQEFIRTQNLLSAAEKMNIIVAYLNGEPVACHLAANLGDTAVMLLAATNEQGLTCRVSYLIWYRAILAAMRTGMKLCDLGGIDPKDNPTVCQFKSRMGGKESFHIGVFEACTTKSVRRIWHTAEKIYNMFRR